MYVNTIADLFESADMNQSDKAIPTNNLNTVRLPNGNVGILSYDWARIGEIEPTGDVIVYEGHRGHTHTTDCHLTRLQNHFDDSRIVRLSSNPVDGSVPETIEFAGSYVGGYDSMSPVDEKAQENVRSTMKRRLSHKK